MSYFNKKYLWCLNFAWKKKCSIDRNKILKREGRRNEEIKDPVFWIDENRISYYNYFANPGDDKIFSVVQKSLGESWGKCTSTIQSCCRLISLHTEKSEVQNKNPSGSIIKQWHLSSPNTED